VGGARKPPLMAWAPRRRPASRQRCASVAADELAPALGAVLAAAAVCGCGGAKVVFGGETAATARLATARGEAGARPAAAGERGRAGGGAAAHGGGATTAATAGDATADQGGPDVAAGAEAGGGKAAAHGGCSGAATAAGGETA